MSLYRKYKGCPIGFICWLTRHLVVPFISPHGSATGFQKPSQNCFIFTPCGFTAASWIPFAFHLNEGRCAFFCYFISFLIFPSLRIGYSEKSGQLPNTDHITAPTSRMMLAKKTKPSAVIAVYNGDRRAHPDHNPAPAPDTHKHTDTVK